MTKKNPLQLSEHQIQVQVCQYLDLIKEPYFAIPNGGVRSIGLAVKLKKEGVKAGTLDMFLMRLRLFLEMKTKIGRLSPAQKEFIVMARGYGYRCEVAHGFEEAKGIIDRYRKPDYMENNYE